MDVQEATRLALNLAKGHGTIKVVNLEAKPIASIAQCVAIKIGD